jgi:hypothetical protein
VGGAAALVPLAAVVVIAPAAAAAVVEIDAVADAVPTTVTMLPAGRRDVVRSEQVLELGTAHHARELDAVLRLNTRPLGGRAGVDGPDVCAVVDLEERQSQIFSCTGDRERCVSY